MGKKKATEVSAPPPPVTYAEYACKWEGCKARLHNLATLKKHVNKVHGKPDPKGRFTCKWENCPKMIQVADKETGAVREIPQYHHFPNQELMFEHVDKTHVGPIAWKLGDGPPGGLSGIYICHCSSSGYHLHTSQMQTQPIRKHTSATPEVAA